MTAALRRADLPPALHKVRKGGKMEKYARKMEEYARNALFSCVSGLCTLQICKVERCAPRDSLAAFAALVALSGGLHLLAVAGPVAGAARAARFRRVL